MKRFELLYVPIGVPTFHMESASHAFVESAKLLRSIEENTDVPSEMLLSIDLLAQFLEGKNPDFVIVQNVTFANSAYMSELLKRVSAPVLLWTLPEPVIDGGRLRLNSLTGAFSAGHAFKHHRDSRLLTLYGSPENEATRAKLFKIIAAAKLKTRLKQSKLLMIGHTPQGFGFGRALDWEMSSVFGVSLLAMESREFTQIARTSRAEDLELETKEANAKMAGLDQTDPKNRIDFLRLFKAYKDHIEKHDIQMIASRCWPDFFVDYGTPVCGVLGLLNDLGIAAACEADAYGALSMWIGGQLSNEPAYLGDPVSFDETENTVTFWHCGTSACSLARKDRGAQTGVHPNRKIGPTMEFGLRPSKQATLFRIGRKKDGSFRFLITSGEILDKPQQFLGTSVVFRVKPDVATWIPSLIQDGWEPHFAVLYGDVSEELKILADLFGVEKCIF